MTRRRLAALLLVPALSLIACFLAWPIASAVLGSLYVDTPFAPRRFVGFQNYADLLQDGVARATIAFTFLFAGVSVALEMLCGLGLALAIHPVYRGRALARAAILIPWAIPTVVTAVLWKYLLNDQYGAVNLLLFGKDLDAYRAWLAEPATARLGIIVADVWKTSSFAALLILAGLQAIPEEVHEAARVDGAGPIRRFLKVTLPLLRPALLVALLFRTIDAFRVFDLVYVMTQGAPAGATNVLQFYGYQKMFPEQLFGYGSAVSVVLFVVVAVLGAFALRIVGSRVFDR